MEDLRYASRGLSKYLRQTDAWFLVIGATEYVRELARDVWEKCMVTSWQKTPIALYRRMTMNVGVAPLKPTRFAMAKSPLKVLEYQALGIPAVASPTVYGDWIEDGVNGLIAKRPEDFPRLLRDLQFDTELRAKLIEGGHETARKHFIQDRWVDWHAALISVM